MAVEVDLTAIRGDSEEYDLTVTTPSGGTFDLTDCDLWFTVKKNASDPDDWALIRKTSASGGGITIADQNTDPGKATIYLGPSDTERIVPDSYPYDVQLKDLPGFVTTLITGSITITADVTRSIS